MGGATVTFLPVLHPILLALVVLPVLGLAVWMLVRAQGSLPRLTWILRVLLVIACGALALRPGLPDGSAQTLATDVDIVIVVDNTTSITAEDWAGDAPRIDGVRADVEALAAAYPGARFALISSDNEASLRLPLTTDATALVSSLEVMRPPVTTHSRGTSIGAAATLAQETLERAEEASPDRARMLFYLGDGEQTRESEPESFAQSADLIAGGGVLGYGTAEGGPMREVTGRVDGDDAEYLQYEGSDALSVIDEENLQTIADALGVAYQHRSADAEATFPDPPRVQVAESGGETLGARIDLSWIAALVVAALVLWEVGLASARLRRTLALARPGGDAR